MVGAHLRITRIAESRVLTAAWYASGYATGVSWLAGYVLANDWSDVHFIAGIVVVSCLVCWVYELGSGPPER
ncbi:hypothetical protein ACYOEI_25305 [Singulisphaera rosea]